MPPAENSATLCSWLRFWNKIQVKTPPSFFYKKSRQFNLVACFVLSFFFEGQEGLAPLLENILKTEPKTVQWSKEAQETKKEMKKMKKITEIAVAIN